MREEVARAAVKAAGARVVATVVAVKAVAVKVAVRVAVAKVVVARKVPRSSTLRPRRGRAMARAELRNWPNV